jgi:hypothetical protein
LIIEGLTSDSQAPANDNIPFLERSVGIGIAWLGIWIILHVGVIAFFAIQRKRSAYFFENGIPGIATVLSVEDTGTCINNCPQIELHLEISIPGHKPYNVIHKQCFSPLILAQFQRGSTIPVLVDPKKPKRIIFSRDVES